jgi:hypothetical protein
MAYPQECREIGLTCDVCIDGTARDLASVCPGLRGKSVGQLFAQIYTQTACAKMHARFVRAYAQAGLCDVSSIPVKGPGTAKRSGVRVAAAVA